MCIYKPYHGWPCIYFQLQNESRYAISVADIGFRTNKRILKSS